MSQEAGPAASAPADNLVEMSSGTSKSDKLGSFLRKPVKFFGHTVPMFGAILAILLATAGIATAAFLIYQNTVVAQQQEQAQVVKTEKSKKKAAGKEDSEEETEDVTDQKKNSRRSRNRDEAAAPQVDQDQGAIDNSSLENSQEATEEEAPPASEGQDKVTQTVPSSYDPASEAGSWTGQMLGFKNLPSDFDKSGSYKEGVLACGCCYGATTHPIALNISSVDSSSRTATGTVSFLLHAHNGPIDKDVSSDGGDVYVQDIPFSAVSIDGWRSSGMIDIYSGNGKTVQMSMRLKSGSGDDYSVWIRTVPTDPDPSKPGKYRWGQTDMYTITKN